MDQSALLWILGIVITVVLGLAAAFFVHVKEDSKQHERIATLEERTQEHGKEIRGLRDMRHEIIAQCTQSISDFYLDAIKRVGELKEWISDRLK